MIPARLAACLLLAAAVAVGGDGPACGGGPDAAGDVPPVRFELVSPVGVEGGGTPSGWIAVRLRLTNRAAADLVGFRVQLEQFGPDGEWVRGDRSVSGGLRYDAPFDPAAPPAVLVAAGATRTLSASARLSDRSARVRFGDVRLRFADGSRWPPAAELADVADPLPPPADRPPPGDAPAPAPQTLDAGGEAAGVAFSPDGARLAAALGVRGGRTRGAVRRWDLPADGGPPVPLGEPAFRRWEQAALAFTPDGAGLLSGDEHEAPLATRSETGVTLFEIPAPGPEPLSDTPREVVAPTHFAEEITGLSVSPDGTRAAVSGSGVGLESKLILYALPAGTRVWTVFGLTGFPPGPPGPFSPAGRFLLAVGSETVRGEQTGAAPDGRTTRPVLLTVDAATGLPVFRVRGVSRVVGFSADGGRLLVLGEGGELRRLPVGAAGLTAAAPPAFPPKEMTADRRRFLTLADDRRAVVVRDAETGSGRLRLPVPAGSRRFADTAVSPDGSRLAACTADGRLHLWALRTPR